MSESSPFYGSSEAFQTLVAHFEANDFRFHADSEAKAVQLFITGDAVVYNCRVQLTHDDELIQLRIHYPVLARDPKIRPLVAEALARANHGMSIGNFDIDMDAGDINFHLGQVIQGTAWTTKSSGVSSPLDWRLPTAIPRHHARHVRGSHSCRRRVSLGARCPRRSNRGRRGEIAVCSESAQAGGEKAQSSSQGLPVKDNQGSSRPFRRAHRPRRQRPPTQVGQAGCASPDPGKPLAQRYLCYDTQTGFHRKSRAYNR